ncbi:hypothetical protein B0H15DRAFT_802523 [Mycena belliarum]|uniref:Uncharacterized protein n=1 Tax=Mycena belliarum TaxID=1033014 RepID=A0AAD6U4K0_9AGAR|nr:hypothetical protein B0H15DRAFT_802523 [Mycena belliae]
MPTSSIETDDHSWLASLWPEHLRFFHALDLKETVTEYERFSVVPNTTAGYREWAYVGRNPAERDATRGLLLLYKSPPSLRNAPHDALFPVGIRVQGFIERCNMKTLGTWASGRTPASALHFIVLSGGKEYADVFAQYKAAVRATVEYIFRCLDVQPSVDDEDPDTMFITRRVFTKVTGSNRMKPSALERGDDPLGVCQAVERDWRILSKPSVGMYVADDVDPSESVIAPCDGMALTAGDFVDVCVGFDIMHKRTRTGEVSVQVHLKLEHVMLLAPAEENVAQIPHTDLAPKAEGTTDVTVQNPGMTFF